jgi:hypothetical protein
MVCLENICGDTLHKGDNDDDDDNNNNKKPNYPITATAPGGTRKSSSV